MIQAAKDCCNQRLLALSLHNAVLHTHRDSSGCSERLRQVLGQECMFPEVLEVCFLHAEISACIHQRHMLVYTSHADVSCTCCSRTPPPKVACHEGTIREDRVRAVHVHAHMLTCPVRAAMQCTCIVTRQHPSRRRRVMNTNMSLSDTVCACLCLYVCFSVLVLLRQVQDGTRWCTCCSGKHCEYRPYRHRLLHGCLYCADQCLVHLRTAQSRGQDRQHIAHVIVFDRPPELAYG